MKAHELLSDRNKWTKGELSRRVEGTFVEPRSPAAVSWCIIGAAIRCHQPRANYTDAVAMIHAAVRALGFKNAGEWNDAPERTFAEVRDLLIKLDT